MANPRGLRRGLLSAISQEFNVENAQLPYCVTLTSDSANKKIEFSTDNGANYFPPQYDVTTSNQLIVTVDMHLTDIRFTGNVGDSWRIAE